MSIGEKDTSTESTFHRNTPRSKTFAQVLKHLATEAAHYSSDMHRGVDDAATIYSYLTDELIPAIEKMEANPTETKKSVNVGPVERRRYYITRDKSKLEYHHVSDPQALFIGRNLETFAVFGPLSTEQGALYRITEGIGDLQEIEPDT